MGKDTRINVEYVSANPTGPMHMGHCRGAVVGDALCGLLEFAGHTVTREYYVNDAGGQVDVLARSAHHRYREALGQDAGELAEGLYPGDYLIPVGKALAEELGIDPDWLRSPEGVAVLSGNAVADGSDPIACVYAGHQFGNYNPQLGDGRALLLGEVIDTQGRRRDLQLKGSGPTPYSRGGDGKSPLGPVIREYLLSEAMHRLGVPTTRALSAMSTGDKVYRERALPGGILERDAHRRFFSGAKNFVQRPRDALHAPVVPLAKVRAGVQHEKRHAQRRGNLDLPRERLDRLVAVVAVRPGEVLQPGAAHREHRTRRQPLQEPGREQQPKTAPLQTAKSK